MDRITSRHNPVYKSFAAAKKDKDLMLLEGRRLVEDALKRSMTPKMAAVTPEYVGTYGMPSFSCTIFEERLFANLADTVTPQGIIAFFDIPWADFSTVLPCEKILVLDSLQDPGNVGTIIRTAEAFGFTAVVLTQGTASPFSPKAVRASMGSCLGMCIAQADPARLKTLPHTIVSLVLQGESVLHPALFAGKVAICLGQEGAGLSREILEISHKKVSIPMKGPTESLNVAVAAGIVMAYASGAIV
ncbi:MAG TPA: RNA methyltransferase [Deltaproteobacteria bacterium]|nr:RNA methyltransferase [Deltaproteobacteria bacterium]HPJ94285.1 RNA methyltransferase [Deltaproteobacteria bacterium]HPR52401.1 RNA methyltransferase [Deltaproteobacteria bacterium]